MTPSQFIGQNIHFAVGLFAALACFTAGWLYFDAWNQRKKVPGLLKWLGFYLLASAFLTDSLTSELTATVAVIALSLKLAGYVAIIAGDVIEPLQPRPNTAQYMPAAGLFTTGGPGPWLLSLLPAAALTAAGLYWRRATAGLERHLKPLAYTFTVFALGDVLALAALWRNTDNPLLQPIVSITGPFWIAQHLAVLAGAAMLSRWIWRYLTKRLMTQIFMTSTATTVAVVLLTTMSITSLLYNSLQHDSLASLETSGKVLTYAVESKTAETRANAEIIAQDPVTVSAVTAGDHSQLAKAATTTLAARRLSEIIITNDDGQVLARATDPDRYGDSLSDNTIVRRALTGTTTTSFSSRTGVLAPTLLITTASPVRQGTLITGVTLVSLALDNSFVAGIKHTTGLDSTVYAGNTRAATTLTAPDGSSQAIGTKETNTAITTTTLDKGQTWRGNLSLSNQPYLGTYLPLKDIDNEIIGMLFVGQPAAVLLQTAGAAIKLTFGVATALILLMMPVLYIVSRKIANQLR